MKQTPKEVIKQAGLNYAWYINEAKAIVKELQQGEVSTISEQYVEEKIKHIQQLFKDIKSEVARQCLIKEEKEKIKKELP